MNIFKGITLSLMTALLFAITATSASAASVTGAITFSADFDPTGGTGGLDDATGLNFLGDDFTVDGVTGSFLAEAISPGDTGSINDFTFAPFPVGGVTPLWAIGDFSFDLESVVIIGQGAGALGLAGTGTIHYDGIADYDDTYGTWTFTGNGSSGSLFNFSAGTTVVPLPAAAWLFGSALFGLVAAARRRQTA